MKINSLSNISQKYSKVLFSIQKQISVHPRLSIGIVLLIISVASLIWVQIKNSSDNTTEQITNTTSVTETASTTTESKNTTEHSDKLTTKLVAFGKKINLELSSPSPSNTPTPQVNNTNSGTANPNTNQPTSSPTPAGSSSGSNQPSATPTAGTTVTPVQPSPTRVAPTLTATPIPTSAPTSGPIQSSSTVTLLSASGATPNAFGSVSFAITQNSNGYWDFVTSGSFQMLQPNRPYQLWICSEGCSSHVNARFTTDGAGSGSIANATINYPQGRYPAQTVRVHELTDVPPGEVIPADSSRCYQMSGMTPCLQSSVSF